MKDKKKIRYAIISIIVLMITITGSSYAYFAISASNSTAINGVAANVGLVLSISKITPETSGTDTLIPQLESALGTAISNQYKCIDDNNNTVCQVYKASLTNNGNATVRVKGTIAFSNINNIPHLKWKLIDSATSIGSNTGINATTRPVKFITETTLTNNQTKDYYFVVWIDETGSIQNESGTFTATLTFTDSNGTGLTSTIGAVQNGELYDIVKEGAVLDNISSTYVSSASGIDFTQNNSDTNGKGVYIRSGTENDANPIYYFRGNVDNNNIIFANTCFKMVRTTDTGGVKLIYNGVPIDGECTSTGTASQIGKIKFNTNNTSLSDVGYMYGTRYARASNTGTGWYYAPDVTYSGGTYTLTSKGSYNVETKSDISGTNLSYQHYTCGSSTDTTCTSVRYVYYVSGSTAYYIILTNGKKIEDALSDMLDNNTTSSSIKGNSTTSSTVDYWYYNNIENKNDSKGNSYSTYIEDTVYCNDRSFNNYSESGWNPDGGSTSTDLHFGAYGRSSDPSVVCPRVIDRFSKSSSIGNGKLNYPVGLLTADEARLAGGSLSNSSYYLYTGQTWWLASPFYFRNGFAIAQYVLNYGNLDNSHVGSTAGVRPVISLVGGVVVSGGDGTVDNPYIVKEE